MSKAYAVALGTFDGVHIGHQAVLQQALQSGLCPAAVSFRRPPKGQMGARVPLLMPPEEKEALLQQLGFETQLYLDFNAVRDMTPAQFLDDIFAKYSVGLVACGFNYRFGKNGAGDVAFLEQYCAAHGARLQVCGSVTVDGKTVSSTEIRRCIGDGKPEQAAKMLGRPYSISGQVIHGDARGRTIGFPTVNQLLREDLAVPKFGVYAARCRIDGKTYKAVTNIGLRPTFRLQQPMAETYICDFSGDLYGRVLCIELLRFLRPEKQFSGLEELKNTIAADLRAANGSK